MSDEDDDVESCCGGRGDSEVDEEGVSVVVVAAVV